MAAVEHRICPHTVMLMRVPSHASTLRRTHFRVIGRCHEGESKLDEPLCTNNVFFERRRRGALKKELWC